jgi:hypothetical protein
VLPGNFAAKSGRERRVSAFAGSPPLTREQLSDISYKSSISTVKQCPIPRIADRNKVPSAFVYCGRKLQSGPNEIALCLVVVLRTPRVREGSIRTRPDGVKNEPPFASVRRLAYESRLLFVGVWHRHLDVDSTAPRQKEVRRSDPRHLRRVSVAPQEILKTRYRTLKIHVHLG